MYDLPQPLPVIDAHVHLWDPARHPMPWLAGRATLERAYGPADLAAAAERPLAGYVFVEAGVSPEAALREAAWAVAQAADDPLLVGIVAAAPLERGALARPHLEALVALGPLIKGARRNLQDEPDPAFCLTPGFVAGVRLLAEYGLSCDLCIHHHQLPSVTELAGCCPEVRFILDHLGKPPVARRALDPWREQLAALARLPNVACKLSGLATEAGPEWEAADLEPYVAHALLAFGPERVLFGGDWPVLLEVGAYRGWVRALAAMTASLSPQAKRGLWAENAAHWYRLPALA